MSSATIRRLARIAPVSLLFLMPAPFLTSLAVAAGARDDVLVGVSSCANITDDRLWLDCFYGAAQPMRSHLQLPPAPQSQILLATRQAHMAVAQPALPAMPLQPAAPQAFGLDSLVQSAPRPAVNTAGRTSARLAAYSFDAHRHFMVTLANGQIWRQSKGDELYAGWDKPPAQYVVTIRRGLMGDYNLATDDGTGSYKVERIR